MFKSLIEDLKTMQKMKEIENKPVEDRINWKAHIYDYIRDNQSEKIISVESISDFFKLPKYKVNAIIVSLCKENKIETKLTETLHYGNPIMVRQIVIK